MSHFKKYLELNEIKVHLLKNIIKNGYGDIKLSPFFIFAEIE